MATTVVSYDSSADPVTSRPVNVSPTTPMPVQTMLGGTGNGTDRSATVGTTSATLIPANPTRSSFFVKNDGANNVWINLGGTATTVAGNGNIKVAANGGYYDLGRYTGAVNAIAETAPVAVTAREF